jgi:hypothetical protein
VKASKTSQADNIKRWLESLSAGLRFAALMLPPEELEKAFTEYQATVHMSAHRLALCAVKEHYPKQVLYDEQEAAIRDIGEKAYRTLKQNNET